MDLNKAWLYSLDTPQLKRLKKKQQRKAERKKRKKEHNKVLQGYQKDLAKNATPAELEFQKFLDKLNIPYQFQRQIRTQKKDYIVDFYINRYHLVIEIDGDYHDNDEQRRHDKTRQNNLMRSKIVAKVIRFKNDEVFRDNLYEIFIKRFIPFAKPGSSY